MAQLRNTSLFNESILPQIKEPILLPVPNAIIRFIIHMKLKNLFKNNIKLLFTLAKISGPERAGSEKKQECGVSSCSQIVEACLGNQKNIVKLVQ